MRRAMTDPSGRLGGPSDLLVFRGPSAVGLWKIVRGREHRTLAGDVRCLTEGSLASEHSRDDLLACLDAFENVGRELRLI